MDTPEFYQRLIGPHPPIDQQTGFHIATGIELETLITCSDGSFDPASGQGSHGWVVSTNDRIMLAKGAGPADGHPNLMSSYRVELGGLVAILYTVFRICQHYQVLSGKVKYHCDNKGVINNVFSPRAPTLSQFLKMDYDLVHTAKKLLQVLPVTIIAEWVKGHYDGEHREYKHDINDMADKLATTFAKTPPADFTPKAMPKLLPNYAIQLQYEGSIITTRLYSIMSQELHRKAIIDYVKKKSEWTDREFSQVNWDAHGKAFTSLNRGNQIMVAKLIHHIANTNQQNSFFYGKSPTCPCCQTANETLPHLLYLH